MFNTLISWLSFVLKSVISSFEFRFEIRTIEEMLEDNYLNIVEDIIVNVIFMVMASVLWSPHKNFKNNLKDNQNPCVTLSKT